MVTLEYIGRSAMELWDGTKVGEKDEDGNPVGQSTVTVTKEQADELLARDRTLGRKLWKKKTAATATAVKATQD